MKEEYRYIAIDLKSFFASVECVERNLNPLTTNLVVADSSRTEKTICLAVSPSLKKFGIPGRARLFEVVQKMREVNALRRCHAPRQEFVGKSCFEEELNANPELEIDYLVAPPQMARYMEYSTRIYNIYLRYVAPEDIHVYSIDEVFIDVSQYLNTYHMTARELLEKMIHSVYQETGITATGGIGTNLYLCKVAMDIIAKRVKPNEMGVRIAELDEMSYRRLLWSHKPISDFWRVGRGYRKKLESVGLYTMGDVARCSLGAENDYYNEDLLYKLFGINAELLIDHAWGWEPTTIEMIKKYKPATNSISSGQVLQYPYDFEKARLIVQEMTDLLVLDLVEKKLVTDQVVLTVGYDIQNMSNKNILKNYKGELSADYYGRTIPKHAHGTENLKSLTSSTRLITEAMMKLYDRIVQPNLLVRRITVVANHVVDENSVEENSSYEQLELFTDYTNVQKEREAEQESLKKERKLQEAMLAVKKKYGKNALLKGMNLQEGATTRERNEMIGGHKS